MPSAILPPSTRTNRQFSGQGVLLVVSEDDGGRLIADDAEALRRPPAPGVLAQRPSGADGCRRRFPRRRRKTGTIRSSARSLASNDLLFRGNRVAQEFFEEMIVKIGEPLHAVARFRSRGRTSAAS